MYKQTEEKLSFKIGPGIQFKTKENNGRLTLKGKISRKKKKEEKPQTQTD